MSEKNVIEAINISKEVQLGDSTKLSILKGISLTAKSGEFTSIIGISGSGKTTLLKCLSGLMEPSAGTVQLDGVDPYMLTNRQLAKLRREKVSFIFQSYNLVPALPVLENIALPLRLSRKKVDKEKIINLLSSINFNAGTDSFIESLSGGEQQKVAVARAIISDSQYIFADEPTGALDSLSREAIFNLLRELSNSGKCIVMVTHDIELAAKTDRALVLKDGKIAQEIRNPTDDILYRALRDDRKI
ncbi:ABC transporter ATP-binding protein [Streptococcus porcinus]|uniref:ABC transporter ATP-binding protein n=1 Tax=Streptococcus porcinus TaxID=1340 RepID=A0A7V9WR53_STRPO|nr:ABC transporter ATP-binding protein [Streptococcus porcinus]MBA2795519.1 ABC transporter ATP-binding protein [Streptococcus porcinus]